MNSLEVTIGDLRFNPETGALTFADGSPVDLRHKSKEVLAHLVANAGQTVRKDAFFTTIWPDVAVGDESLAQCISDIRKLVGDDAKRIIQTVPREGYQLALVDVAARPRHRALLTAAFVLLTGLVSVAGWIYFQAPEARSGPPVVAVLPMEDLSLGENKGALGDMLSEGIITDLARYTQLKVIAKNSSFQFRKGGKDIDTIANALGVDYILTGSQQFDGEAVRVSFQLVDTRDGTHVFSDRFDRQLGDVFSVQDDIVTQIAAISGQTLMKHVTRVRGPEDVSSMMLNLRAFDAIAGKFSKENFNIAYDLQTRNVELYPDSPWGYMGVALLLRGAATWGWLDEPNESILARAKESAETALKLDPNNYMAHYTRARVHSQSGEPEEAIYRFEQAVALNPSASDILIGMSDPLLYLGRNEEALEALERAKSIDPLHGNWLFWQQGWAYWQTGECNKGIIAMNSMSHAPDTSKRMLAGLYACAGDKEKATAALKIWLKERPNYTIEDEISSTYDGTWKVEQYLGRWIKDMRFAGMPE